MKVIIKDVTEEVFSRIVKAEAKKYDVPVEIKGTKAVFLSHEDCKPHIEDEVINLLKRR